MAELFLQDLKPAYLARPELDLGYDFFLGFENPSGGINTVGVEVKATEDAVGGAWKLRRSVFRRLAGSNIPAILLVVDVKNNDYFFSWMTRDLAGEEGAGDAVEVPLQRVGPDEKASLRTLLSSDLGSASGGHFPARAETVPH